MIKLFMIYMAFRDCDNGLIPRFKNKHYLEAYGRQYEYNERLDFLTSLAELRNVTQCGVDYE